VFWNVLSNALKFTGTEGAITVTLRNIPGRVELAIADTGIGIRPDVLPFVFDRFWQADSSTTRTHGGLGLGLSIVRHIVELHGGTVHASSEGEGKGATFIIQLPIVDQADSKAGDIQQEAASGSAAIPRRLHGRVILVVEDDDDARELVTEVLENAGARVVPAASSQEAMDLAANMRPDMLLADVGLPGEDGYTLLGRLRVVYPDVPAIAVTAYARPADRTHALSAGFQQHLIKPIDPGELVDQIVSLL
jgi:CheY-like chemotaxis protein